MNVCQCKKQLRRFMKDKLKPSSQVVCESYLNWELFIHAKVVHCFMSLPHEIDLSPFIEQCYLLHKTVVIPKFSKQKTDMELAILNKNDQLITGDFGVRQPSHDAKTIAVKEVDLWLIPGLAFSLSGERLGYGKGYYDRLLADTDKPLVGVCFEQQIIEQIPTNHFDIAVNHLMTEVSLIHI